jgi:hypothetical protein
LGGTLAGMTSALAWLWNVLTSGVVAAVIAWVVAKAYNSVEQRALERLRADLDRETHRLDAQQKTLDERASTRYSWVYEERAKAMSEIYSRLIEAVDAFEDFGRSWGSLPGQEGPKARWLVARDAGEAFLNAYRPKRLLFTPDTAAKLDNINREFTATFYAYYVELHIAKDNEYEALQKFMAQPRAVPQTASALKDIESDFRRLYGSAET